MYCQSSEPTSQREILLSFQRGFNADPPSLLSVGPFVSLRFGGHRVQASLVAATPETKSFSPSGSFLLIVQIANTSVVTNTACIFLCKHTVFGGCMERDEDAQDS